MPYYTSYDAARLSFRVLPARDGDGRSRPPLVCLAGGPGRDAAYLGDLGGLDAHRDLIAPDSRGTGDSPTADPQHYAFPRLAEDLEALRAHLELERLVLLAHGAAATTAQAYAAAHPERTARLVLVCPDARLQGERTGDAWEIFRSRADEPWWPEADRAARRLAERHEPEEVRALLAATAPAAYDRWEEPQRAHAADEAGQSHPVPRAGFWQGVDEAARRAVLARLAELPGPVLVVSGDRDAVAGVRAGELVAASVPDGRHHTLPGAGHYPWVDRPAEFRTVVEEFLGG
ncbi:alpha/beta hydrolase [Streptomyces pactum]|uniref:Alpha/beta hydrolase n=1 Tax=Streptomyces pactum TaxID=68249 RepID=A0ABS0NND9_9ACTN|nr:alpha/beta hydrolase [Streptomyces pactum]MBH5336719.1 alpha/beta hydrolase [Streptomyces pactum]